MKKICVWLMLIAWMLVMSMAEAVTISPGDVPEAYRDCRPECFVLTTSVVDIGAMNAFRVVERSANGFEVNWLLRYSVYSTDPTSTSYMWLHARSSYDLLSTQHAISLLVDQTALPPDASWPDDADPRDWDFLLTSDALLAGTGQYAVQCCSNQTPELSLLPLADSPYPGQEWLPGGLRVCLAEGCEAQAQVNFVYFMYQLDPTGQMASLVFDPTRSQSLLYSQSSAYDGRDGTPFFMEHNFQVAPVPLPAPFVLLISGLGALSTFSACRPSVSRNRLA